MRNLVIILFAFILVLGACNQEPPKEVNAEFKTNLVDNIAFAGETFYIYLDGTSGEFFTLFRGLTESTTYDPADPTRTGESIQADTDSVAVTYSNGGEYQLTMVASSSGNWSEDYESDVHTLMVNVVDNRAEFISMEVDRREGTITPDDEILFYAHKLEDFSNARVRFRTASSGAEVYVDGVLQEDARNRHDFSPLNPGDDEGRPVVYEVIAPNGDTKTYTAKFIYRDPSSEKTLFSLSSSDFAGSFTINEGAKTVLVEYYQGDNIEKVGLQAVVSTGALAEFDGEEISEDEEDVSLIADTTILVTAEDLSTVEYMLEYYAKERIDTFAFTGTDDGGTITPLNPVFYADVDFETRSMTMEVPENLDLSSIVASFTGITDFTVEIEATDGNPTTLESGVTPFDYSVDDTNDPPSEAFNVKVYDDGVLIDTYVLTVITY